MTDEQICEIVSEAIADANRDGWAWPGIVDAALAKAGVALSDDQPDGSDPWEIVRLADGRMVYLADESATGAAQYRIR